MVDNPQSEDSDGAEKAGAEQIARPASGPFLDPRRAFGAFVDLKIVELQWPSDVQLKWRAQSKMELLISGQQQFDEGIRKLLEPIIGSRYSDYFYRLQTMANWEAHHQRAHSGQWIRRDTGVELAPQ